MKLVVQAPVIRLLFLVLFSAGCSTVRVGYEDVSPGFKIEDYRSFGFYDTQVRGDTIAGRIEKGVQLIREDIAAELRDRGLEYRPEDPDIVVSLGIMVRRMGETGATAKVQPLDGNRIPGNEDFTLPEGQFREGSLDVQLIHAAKGNLLWRKTIEGALEQHHDPDREALRRAIHAAFRDLP